MLMWFLTTHLELSCLSFLFCRASTIGGLRCWNLSLQSGVVIVAGIRCITGGLNLLSASSLAFLSIALIADCAIALFTELYFVVLDLVAISTGCVFFLLFYPWHSVSSAPRALSTPLIQGVPWITIPAGIGLLLPALLLMLTIIVFLLIL